MNVTNPSMVSPGGMPMMPAGMPAQMPVQGIDAANALASQNNSYMTNFMQGIDRQVGVALGAEPSGQQFIPTGLEHIPVVSWAWDLVAQQQARKQQEAAQQQALAESAGGTAGMEGMGGVVQMLQMLMQAIQKMMPASGGGTT